MWLKLKRVTETLQTKAAGETFQLHVAVLSCLLCIISHVMGRTAFNDGGSFKLRSDIGAPKNGENGFKCQLWQDATSASSFFSHWRTHSRVKQRNNQRDLSSKEGCRLWDVYAVDHKVHLNFWKHLNLRWRQTTFFTPCATVIILSE